MKIYFFAFNFQTIIYSYIFENSEIALKYYI